ncbi:RNA-directed DNA polymerase [Pseudoflavonifractor phocaeensis]|uniref:RNA-directed DNA polymerase n=1 Tax=Pseudoflavonifractor phocaeensis TaxID=1870988 RepID=UPI0019590682|nr:RNA-directed DNA polymerase [Pseudoflavonifractor phocaeensis]MBM6871848.1 RNA-directed DNA polymerase [Pseudoflavonifractor phocaeensis]
MKRSKNNIERNKLDYILTDIMPVEVSELFSYSKFYEYLLSKQSTLDDIVSQMHAMKAENSETPFSGGKWGNWATSPLKFNILKGTDSIRELNLVQPLSAMNIYFFVECYQKELLDILSNNACFSLRYHRKNSDLFYRRKSKKIVDYFEKISQKVDRAILQQTGAYFKIHKFNSVSSFTNSRLWQQCNFKYRNFAKIDYKSCFDSIYTHAYKWCIEKDTVDSKEASNANLHIVIDRVLQNINGRSSNGLIVGPEFSRMIAEVLLQEIDVEVKHNLAAQGLNAGADYRVFRYVDDIYIFSHTQAHTDLIIKTIERAAQKYLLKFNEFKYLKAYTPVVLSSWLGKARALSDRISALFYRKQELHDMAEKKPLLKSGYISVDRIKDDFIYLVNEFPKEQRYIVSFMLSTLLNNISNKKDGYALFEPDKCARAFVLLDLAMYIYSFCPCFEHTQKLISMIVYMDDELQFSKDELNHKKLINLIRRYSFVFEKGNMNDLCNWFLFFHDYSIPLLRSTETIFEKKLREEDNPILWANYLIYSRYHSDYHQEILTWVEEVLQYKVNQIGSKDPLLQKEFWYVITFINCPYISSSVKTALENIVRPMATAAETNLANKIKKIIAEFLLQNKSNLFFCWGYYHFNTSKQLTFRTYQRTLFKQYKNKRSIELYGSLDT